MQPTFKCKQCGQTLATGDEVLQHINAMHPETPDDAPVVEEVPPETVVTEEESTVQEEVPPLPPEASAGIPTHPSGEPRVAGRPTKYKPEYNQQIISHMAKGYSMESFGGVIEVSKDTLYEWEKAQNEDGSEKYLGFSDAVKIGRQKSLMFWETIGINGTVGKPSYYIDKITGKEVATDKFNPQTYALHMANKHKWVSNKTDVTSDGKELKAPTVVIDMGEKKE